MEQKRNTHIVKRLCISQKHFRNVKMRFSLVIFEFVKALKDPWSFLEIVFVGQCEVFVCLGFV